MEIRKLVFKGLLLAGLFAGFTSCSDDDDNDNPVINITDSHYGAYVLSAGKYGSNTGTLYYYNLDSNTTHKAQEAFASANGINLGDTGQDMIVYGSKMYIGMYGSGLIYVTDKNAKIIATIKDDENKLQPRSFETLNGKVYVTLYDGYLARIDTTSLTIDKKIEVGPNPEGVKAANSKLYVANSGGMSAGYNTTVSIVDSELTSKKDIEVVINPCELKTDDNGNLFLVSRGNYGDIPNCLQQINTTTNEVTVIDEGRSYSIFPIGNNIHMLNKAWGDNGVTSTFIYYNSSTKKIVEESLIGNDVTIADINAVTVDPSSKDIFITAADGSNNGDVYIFSSEGKLKSKFETGSAYPSGVWFVKK